MPGLYSLATWTALPLKSSCVKACANGYSLGVTAHLTYINSGEDPVEGVFIYPLEESEVVAGFEAMTGSRSITFQIQNRHRAEDCCVDCSPSLGQPLLCANGHLILDEDLERSTFILSTGPIGPSEILTVVFSSSQELSTLPDGALHITFPSILTPLVVAIPESASEPGGLCDDSPTSCFGASGLRSEQSFIVPPESTDVFRGQAYNPFPYEFSFELLVKGPCLLAGLESPSHALRADANPYANSASTICVTLAEGHQCDRSLEIILYPCEPHCPHLVIEAGAMTYQEYEAHIRSRRDYVRIAKKDSDGERQVAFVQKRFHKDIFHNPVLMLNFCPEVGSVPTDLQTVTREILFLIDQSGSMSGPNIIRIKEALLVAVKSLPSGTLLNIAGFGSHIKPLFPASKPCTNVSVVLACEHIQKLRANMHGTNLLAALTWILGQPLHRGYPRQLFIFADANVSNAGKIIELIRRQASTVRCFSFGLGSGACRRLLRGLAKVSKGRAEFLSPEERLQPKLIKSLKKAIEPAVSDITIDWYVPDTMEALLSPNEIAALYPGDRLISYCTLYNIASFRDKKTGRERVCRSLSRGSVGSAFQSQDEAFSPDVAHPYPAGESQDISQALQEISREISLEFSAGGVEESEKSEWSVDPVSDIWKRIYQASYIQEQYVLTHCSISTDRSQGLLSHGSTSSESTGSRDIAPESGSLACTLEANSQQGQKSVSLCDSSTKSAPLPQACVALSSEELARRKKALARAALSGRSFSSPHGELDAHRLRRALEKVPGGAVSHSAPGLHSGCLLGNLLSPSHLDWDMLVEPPYLFSASPAAERGECEGGACLPLRCQVVIHALSAGKPISWEVTATLEPLLQARDGELPQESCKAWDKVLHHLTASSVIRDHENVAQREAELEHSFSRRLRLKAIQSSKACNTPSIYTCLVPVDSSTQEVLPRALEVRNAGTAPRLALSSPLVPQLTSRDPWDSELMSTALPMPAASRPCCSLVSSPGRFSLSRIRGHGLALRPQCLTPANELSKDSAIHDYLPLVRLQQALGTFQLTESFSEVVQIPLDRLRRASPYASHRASLSPGSCTSPWALVAKGSPDGGPNTSSEVLSTAIWPQADSGRGSETDACDHSPVTSEAVSLQEVGLEADEGDLESASWATAVALAWLEHRCAGFFVEWELLAAKADAWLRAQQLPEGVDVGSLKGAARHLFLLLRHWDENIKLNMLCYNPSNM
uniref:von Willebrand factor A domain containing 5B2 n=1 Tax=Terrapene triunguis TaxID=2587831 RepID=A0A674J345_9SAUR